MMKVSDSYLRRGTEIGLGSNLRSGKINTSEYAREVRLHLSSNVEEAGQKDSQHQIILNCVHSVVNQPEVPLGQHLSRLANEYITAKGSAVKLLKNEPLFELVVSLLQFSHHENRGQPNLTMFKLWGAKDSHGPVRDTFRLRGC